jgi:uncharacterized damage-inducible protein DinB
MAASLLTDGFAHHVWATDHLLEACEALSPDQLRAPAPGAYGSVAETLRHLVATDVWYLTFFPVSQPPPLDEKAETSLADLRAAMMRNAPLWTAVLAAATDGDEDVVEQGDGWEFHSPLGLRLAQALHHGTDHRSQVCTALTSLGVEPPRIDLWAFGQATGRTSEVER